MRVVWTEGALNDLDQMQLYIGRQSPAAAYKLASAIITRTETMLADNPMIGRRGRVAGSRELVAAGTPYIVVYEVHEDVEILAVIHGARDWPESFGTS